MYLEEPALQESVASGGFSFTGFSLRALTLRARAGAATQIQTQSKPRASGVGRMNWLQGMSSHDTNREGTKPFPNPFQAGGWDLLQGMSSHDPPNRGGKTKNGCFDLGRKAASQGFPRKTPPDSWVRMAGFPERNAQVTNSSHRFEAQVKLR